MKTECTSGLRFLNSHALIGFALYAAGLVLAFAPISGVAAGDNAAAELSQSVPTQPSGTWRATGDLVSARYTHTATLLPNGQVLVAGGFSDDPVDYLASAELYDPATGLWTATHPFAPGRSWHAATLLRNGRVLVSGGLSLYGAIARAQLYKSAPEGLDIE